MSQTVRIKADRLTKKVTVIAAGGGVSTNPHGTKVKATGPAVHVSSQKRGAKVVVKATRGEIELGVLAGHAPGIDDTVLVSAGPLSADRIATTDADGNAIYASSDNLSHLDQVIGILMNAVSGADQAVRVVKSGPIEIAGGSFTPGQQLFLGINGAITTDPRTGLFSISIGYAQTATIIFIQIRRPTVLA